MTRRPAELVIAAQLLIGACVTRVPGETDGAQSTGGETESGATMTDPSGSTTGSAGSGGAPSTGAQACDRMVAPTDETPEADPDGCFAVTDEAGCAAKGDACMALFGVPAACAASSWCLPDPDAAVFLGCRPFTICKRLDRVVCIAGEAMIHAFFTSGCTPAGFGPCEPGLDSQDSGPPPACE